MKKAPSRDVIAHIDNCFYLKMYSNLEAREECLKPLFASKHRKYEQFLPFPFNKDSFKYKSKVHLY